MSQSSGGAVDRHHPRGPRSGLCPGVYSLRTGRWHYIWNPKGYRGEKGRFPLREQELYRVAGDRAERVDVLADHPEVANEMRAALERWTADDPSYRPQTLRPEIEAELRALGYLE